MKNVRKPKVEKGAVKLYFSCKPGIAINVYKRLKGETDFIFLGNTGSSPFTDPHPVTAGVIEVREYVLRIIEDHKEAGKKSKILSIHVGGQ